MGHDIEHALALRIGGCALERGDGASFQRSKRILDGFVTAALDIPSSGSVTRLTMASNRSLLSLKCRILRALDTAACAMSSTKCEKRRAPRKPRSPRPICHCASPAPHCASCHFVVSIMMLHGRRMSGRAVTNIRFTYSAIVCNIAARCNRTSQSSDRPTPQPYPTPQPMSYRDPASRHCALLHSLHSS